MPQCPWRLTSLQCAVRMLLISHLLSSFERNNTKMSEESENTQSSSKPVPEELTARRGSASLAWRWFGFDKKDEQQTSPICRIFRKQIAVKQSATTNLFHHLRTTHKTVWRVWKASCWTKQHCCYKHGTKKKNRHNRPWQKHSQRKHHMTKKVEKWLQTL